MLADLTPDAGVDLTPDAGARPTRRRWARRRWGRFCRIWRWLARWRLRPRIRRKARCCFFNREVLALELPWLENVTQAKTPQRLPVVLTASEVKSVLNRLDGALWLIASLLYGGGLRLMECVRLRVKDVDFEMRQVTVREGKDFKDRVTMLPESSIAPYARFTINDPPPPPGTSPKASGRAMPVPPSGPASRPEAKTRRYG